MFSKVAKQDVANCTKKYDSLLLYAIHCIFSRILEPATYGISSLPTHDSLCKREHAHILTQLSDSSQSTRLTSKYIQMKTQPPLDLEMRALNFSNRQFLN